MYGVKAEASLPIGFSKHTLVYRCMTNSQIGRLDGLISTNKQGRSSHRGATDSPVKIRPKGGLLFSCVLLGSFARELGGCWAANFPPRTSILSAVTCPRGADNNALPPFTPTGEAKQHTSKLLYRALSNPDCRDVRPVAKTLAHKPKFGLSGRLPCQP